MGEALHRLLLLRHAKSSHKDQTLRDFERPLNKRGRKDCRRIGKWLKSEEMMPDPIGFERYNLSPICTFDFV